MKTPVRSHAEFLSRICDQFLIIFACMAVPALAASLWRIVDIGWQPVMAVHVALATGAWLIAAFRARIPYRVRAGFIVLSFVIVALGGLWSFGLAAGGVAWLVILPVLATVFFGIRWGLSLFALVLLSAVTIGTLFVFEYRTPAMDLENWLRSVPVWATSIISWTLVGGSMAVAVGALNRFFSETLEESRNATTALAESEREYRNILDNMLDTFYRADREGVIVMISPSVKLLAGYSPEEVMGRKLTEFYVNPEDRNVLIQRLEADGGEVLDYDVEIFDSDGKRRWLSSSTRYWKDADGEVLGVEGIIRDITANREAEDALRRSQKMEAVGQLTGGVAHDFNNLLGVIIGNVEMLETEIGNNPNARRHFNAVENAVGRGSSLIQRLLAFSRKQSLSPRPTAIDAVTLSLEDMLQRTLGETISLRVIVGASDCEALIDPHQFEDALINLALNARDAMPNGGELTIEIDHVDLDEAYAREQKEVTSGHYVKVAVGDAGAGMTAETLENVFEPFFTTKEVGKGSGLGLSMVFGFVKQSGGHVTIDSVPGEGTTVVLYLPQSPEPAVAEDGADSMPVPAGGTERILVVEDDKDLRQIPTSILRGQGYDVVEARDGAEAVACLRDGPAFDLLFSDMVLPGGMSGSEIAIAARKLQPSIKVVFTSGYSENFHDHSGAKTPVLIRKPYRRAVLLDTVQAALDNSGN